MHIDNFMIHLFIFLLHAVFGALSTWVPLGWLMVVSVSPLQSHYLPPFSSRTLLHRIGSHGVLDLVFHYQLLPLFQIVGCFGIFPLFWYFLRLKLWSFWYFSSVSNFQIVGRFGIFPLFWYFLRFKLWSFWYFSSVSNCRSFWYF